MKRTALLLGALAATVGLGATNPDTITICKATIAGPVSYPLPYMTSEKDASGKAFDMNKYLAAPLKNKGTVAALGTIESKGDKNVNVITASFTLNAHGYTNAEIISTGAENTKILIDGKPVKGDVALKTGTHRVDVLMASISNITPEIKVVVQRPDLVTVSEDISERHLTIYDILEGQRLTGVSLSPGGKYLKVTSTDTKPGGTVSRLTDIYNADTGKQMATAMRADGWWPGTDMLYYTQRTGNDRVLYLLNPLTGQSTVKAHNIPDGRLTVSPSGDYIVVSTLTKGPEEGDVYQILEPEDRQPGWRDRESLTIYNIADGGAYPLTFGNVNTWVTDISADSKKVLAMTSATRLEKRPTTVYDILLIDVATHKVDTLVHSDGFINTAQLSPDGKKVLISGSPEALGGVGKNVPKGRIPSMSDGQLFIMDIATGKVDPVTRNFNPAVTEATWSRADGNVWLTAEDGDCVRLYTLNPANGNISVAVRGEDLVTDFAVPQKGNALAWIGQSASNGDRLYLGDKKTQRLLIDAKKDRLADVRLGDCIPWNYVNPQGDTIIGRYYLPPDFDATKKYPVIVNYYGGCSPSERTFESRYPQHLYAAQGYVVYVLNPSGATGRGQEFSSRHVNTAGKGVAEDIIGAVKKFLAEHSFTNSDKVGCIGASYGGFMTQYLLTQTPLFAAGISHAGISDHTSYWGEGYWGYSYSEVSMAGSYPWSDKDLYVNQSPLYNADKINTPLLFLHGDADHNVPVGESIQMFTALKLLGRPTAFVAVKDQDHHILDYDKRIKWTDTIFAWFAKYLKDEPAQWNNMYKD